MDGIFIVNLEIFSVIGLILMTDKEKFGYEED